MMSMTSQELIETAMRDILMASNKSTGICRGEPLTDRGKRKQMIKMLALLFIPVIVLWSLALQSLSAYVNEQMDTEDTQALVRASINLGKIAYRLQKERDLSVFYYSTLGPSTKSFLLREYDNTDIALLNLSEWPIDVQARPQFASREAFQMALSSHRLEKETQWQDLYDEIDFYTDAIDVIVRWIFDSLRESKYGTMWRTLVAYVKIIGAREDVGLERSLGSTFFVKGRFPREDDYFVFLRRVVTSKFQFRSARNYSAIVQTIKEYGITFEERNVSSIIVESRMEIMEYGRVGVTPSIDRGQLWYDSMTIYLDILLEQQQDLAERISNLLAANIDLKIQKVTVSAILLVVVLLISPIVFMAIQSLTGDIQRFAITLVDKTKELSREKRKTDSLIYQMVPKPVAEILKKSGEVDAEYFKDVTIFFSDIVGFSQITTEVSPMEVVTMLNNLYGFMDRTLDRFDVYKVETINDTYMIASGLPQRNGNRHYTEVANLALELVSLLNDRHTRFIPNKRIYLRIGINSGPVVAGIVGSKMPRYCLFGDTVNTASRLESNSLPNQIHISASTRRALRKHGGYNIRCRGSMHLKGKGNLLTYWLTSGKDDMAVDPADDNRAEVTIEYQGQLPGEITHLADGLPSVPTSDYIVGSAGRNTTKSLEELYRGHGQGNAPQNSPVTVQPQEGFYF